MNKFDDFLKSKMSDPSFDVPSDWEDLNAALPALTAGKVLFKWAIALLVVGSMVTTAVVIDSKKTPGVKIADNTKISQSSTGSAGASTSSLTPASAPSASIAQSTLHKGTGKGTIRPALKAMNGIVNTAVAEESPASTPTEKVTALTVTEAIVKNPPVENKADIIVTENKVDRSLMNKKEPDSKPKDIQKTNVRKTVQRSDYHKGKFYVGFSFSPMLSYRSFQLSDGAAPFVNKQYDAIRQNSESKIISLGTALTVEYKFSKKFSLQGGISYNKIGFKSQYEFDVTDKATTDNTGRITGYETLPNPYTTDLNNKTRIDVLRIPFGINYNLFMNSNSLFHFYFGGCHSILLAANGVGVNSLTLEQTTISKADFINTAKEVCVDLGVNIALTPKYAFGVDLYYNKWLTNIAKNKLENVTPFTAGLNLSISRKIF